MSCDLIYAHPHFEESSFPVLDLKTGRKNNSKIKKEKKKNKEHRSYIWQNVNVICRLGLVGKFYVIKLSI